MTLFDQKFKTAVKYYQSGRLDQAQAIGNQLLQRNPKALGVLQLLGEIAMQRGNNDLAEAMFRKAVDGAPRDPQVHYRLGNILFTLRRLDAAARHYRLAIQLKPDYWQCHANLGLLWRSRGYLNEARQCFEEALICNPDLTVVFCYLLDLLLSLGELATIKAWSGKIRALVQRCITDEQERDFAALMYLLPLLSVSRHDYDALAKKMDRLLARQDTVSLQSERHTAKKLRIGYVSPDFGDHPISHVMRGVFGEHDRTNFEIIAYSVTTRSGNIDCEYSQYIKDSCDDYVDLSGLTVQQAAQRISADGTAILVNLSGYMSPPSLEIFSWRPAPVQVYWLGHGGGLGLSFIDYVIADAVVVPPGEESAYREKVVRMPESYHCADTPPIADLSQSRADYGLAEGAFVYCAFNNPNKIDSEVFDIWMNILRRAPGSQIWLSNPASDADLENNLRTEARDRGVSPDRLVFASRVPDKSLHFARHRLADLFLDTFVYNASTTAIDALWSGLPVLTRPGRDFYSRICATHVTNVGLGDMVCASIQEYEDRAVSFASDARTLADVTDRLAVGISTEPLFNQARFVRHLENVYLGMWDRHISGKAPESFDLAALPPHES
jgi:predicted O-linked N-acetylglucosamine transferase (SPINDLY family)